MKTFLTFEPLDIQKIYKLYTLYYESTTLLPDLGRHTRC